jgi:two-component system, cell cycle response regulator
MMRRAARLLLAVCAGWCGLYELHTLGLGFVPVGDVKSGHLVVMGVGALLCLARAADRRDERLAWTLIGLAFASWIAGEIYFTAVLWDDSQPPVPSWADAGYLGLPPLLFAGLVLLLRARIRGLPRTLWVDGITAALAASAVSAAVVVEAVLGAVGGGPLSVATNLAYPLADLVLLGVIAGGLAAGGWRLDRAFGLIVIGVLAFWLADSVYLVRVAEGTWASGGPIEPGWWGAALLFAAAAWQPHALTVAQRPTGPIVIAMPIAFATLALGVLVAGSLATLNGIAVALATASLAAVMVRLILTFQQHGRTLQQTQREALTDALTGLGNRRQLLADLHRACADADTAHELLLFDLNGFKAYNDTFGHAAGDKLLTRLGTALGTAIAPCARAYRLGGDEFCALVPAASTDGLLGGALEALSESGHGFAISAAHGRAPLALTPEGPSEALKLADQRMYATKNSSRASAAVRQLRDVLLGVLGEREQALGDHATDVADWARRVGHALGLEGEQLDDLTRAAELHDIGKAAIPDVVLNKPGPLTDDEWAFMRQHTLIGERILNRAPALRAVGALVRASHERVDGGGYPDGLVGDDIPLGARIIAVCDAYDALTTDRPYRAARSIPEALAELHRHAGTQFDIRVVNTFTALAAEEHGSQPALVGANG